ncbi:MAG: HAMP domain-containing sensor histidine kinase [Alphaproteobacteria bacterium]
MMTQSLYDVLLAPGSPVGSAVFFTAGSMLIAGFLLMCTLMRNRIGICYGLLFAAMLLLGWLMEGGLAGIGLAIGTERSLVLTVAHMAIAFGFFTAERGIDPGRQMPRIRRILQGMALLSLAMILPAWLAPYGFTVLAVNALFAAMFASHIIPTVTWRRADGSPFRLPAIIALALMVALGAVLILGGGTSPFRLLFALVVVPAIGAIGTAVIDMRRSRDAAMAAALAAARKEAATGAALLEMEREYANARETAARRTRQISTASHDIRQPLAALRAELDGLHGAIAPDNAERLDRILDHFDVLTAELARSGRGGESLSDTVAETVPAGLLLSMLERMFGAEARARGIDLRFVASTARFHAPAMVLMRIASNLVSNAIAHSGARRILVGVRPRAMDLRLVVADDGQGFPGGNVEAAMTAGAKGAESGGDGLGLSIVGELAAENGLELCSRSIAGQGTGFAVLAPRAPGE